MSVGSKHQLWGLKFSQQCNWGFKFSGMWPSVVGRVIPQRSIEMSETIQLTMPGHIKNWNPGRVIFILQDNLSRPVYVPKTATEQLKEIFERQRNSVSSLDEKQAEWWNVQVQKLYDFCFAFFIIYCYYCSLPCSKTSQLCFPLNVGDEFSCP